MCRKKRSVKRAEARGSEQFHYTSFGRPQGRRKNILVFDFQFSKRPWGCRRQRNFCHHAHLTANQYNTSATRRIIRCHYMLITHYKDITTKLFTWKPLASTSPVQVKAVSVVHNSIILKIVIETGPAKAWNIVLHNVV